MLHTLKIQAYKIFAFFFFQFTTLISTRQTAGHFTLVAYMKNLDKLAHPQTHTRTPWRDTF